MKIRRDFVSNSSSSSYVVAVDFSKYDVDLFVKKVCDRCAGLPDGAKKRGVSDDVRLANEAVLRQGLMSECLYLGNPVIGKIKERWRRGEEYDHRMIKPGETDEYTPFRELTELDWTLPPGETVTFIDSDTIEHEFNEELPAWLSVPRSIMSERIRKYDRFYTEDKSLAGTGVKARAKRIIEYAKQKAHEKIKRSEPEVFCITKNTTKNTRDLMAVGCKISFTSPIALSNELMSKFLDEIDARLAAGETFIYAVAGDSGEGRDDNRLFMPDGHSNPFEYTPAQSVTGKFIEF